ncbi:MAG: oligoendopeptidase F [Simkaniaceae bacterium]|nr:oligoendopeptidase F [Simkaniaceae bacterium]
MKRCDVKLEDQWNVELLFPSLEGWKSDFSAFKETVGSFDKMLAFKKRLGSSSKTLKDFFDHYFDTARQIDRFYTYAHLRHDEDLAKEEAKIAYNEAMHFYHTFSQMVAWVEPEILALDQKILDGYLKDPILEPYWIHLEKIVKLKPFTLSDKEEMILALAAQPLATASKAFSALNNVDLKFASVKDGEGKECEVTHGLYSLYMQSKDRTLRENAFTSLHKGFAANENTIAEFLSGVVQGHVFEARARGYESTLHAALTPHNIDVSVYHNLIETVRANIKPLHDYVSYRKEVLGLDKVHFYDLYVPIVDDCDQKYTYDEAEKICIEAIEPLGEGYQDDLRRGMTTDRWVDRYENEGKRTGAYSSGCYDSCPYILMNYKGMLNDLMTLAHEAGHSMHSLNSHRSQPYQYSHYSIFVAEVASTFNENLTSRYLMQKATTAKEKRFLINQQLDATRATLYRQTMFAEFELKIHEIGERGESLTPGMLKEVYKQLNADYYGPDFYVDDLLPFECLRIPHFYYNYYVYQYATGISAAHALAERVIHENGRDDYLDFLAAGSSDYPLEILKRAGVDMRTPEPIISQIDAFSAYLNELKTC